MCPPGFGDNYGELFGGVASHSAQAMITKGLVAVGVNPDDTDYREKALTFLNFGYFHRLKGRHWKFLNRELYIDLEAPYETGTVTLTQNDATVVEDTATPALTFAATMVGQTFAIGDSAYRVSSLNSGTSLELTTEYADDTATLQSYKVLFDRISLNENVQAIRSLMIQGLGEINPLGIQEFRAKKAVNPTLEGPPRHYTLVKAEEDSGQWTLELYPAPDKRYACQIEYSARLTSVQDEADQFLLVPPNHLDVIFFTLVADLYAVQENPAMAEYWGKKATQAWVTFSSDQEMTDSVARVQHARRYFDRGRRYRGYFGLTWFGKVEA